MGWLWFFLIPSLSKSVRSNDLFLMTFDKCVTNSTFPVIVNSRFSPEDKTDKLLVQSTINNSCPDLFFNYTCCGLYCSKDWRIKTSSDELITDWRWKGLKTYDLSTGNLQLPIYLFLNDNFILPISVRSTQIQIQFLEKSGLYIVYKLQADTILIRACNQFKHNCTHYKSEKRTNSQTWISENYWSHFILEKNNSVFKAILNNQEIISYKINLTNIERINIFHSSGLIKIHDYEYLYSNQTGMTMGPKINTSKIGCVKFWIRMCQDCFLNIYVVGFQNLILNQTIQTTTWKEIRIKLPKLNHNVLLYLEKISSEQNNIFWAISDISTCSKEGMESITRKINDTCQLVNGYGNLTISSEKYNIGMVQLTEFSYEEEVNNYKQCTDEICGKSKVCSLSFDTFTVSCYCPLGTKMVGTRNCTPCAKGFFGWNCTETCEGCKQGCNYEGLCKNSANTNDTCKSKEYEGEYCYIRPEAVKQSTIKISFNTTNNNSVVNWSYPNLTKNKIRSFSLEVDFNKYTYNVSNDTESFFSKVIEVPPEKTMQFKIQACNRKCSDTTHTEIYTPPLKANINEDNFKFNFYDEGINITLPSVVKKCKKCNTTILLAISNCTKDINFKTDTIWKFNYESYRKMSSLYIKKDNKAYLSNYLNKTFTYPILNCANFKLAVCIISTFNGQENSITKYFKITGKDNKLNQIETHFVTIAVTSSVLLVLLGGIIIFFIRKKFWAGIFMQPESNNQAMSTDNEVEINLLSKSSKLKTHCQSKMIPLINFKDYVKTSLENNDLEKQFQLLSNDPHTIVLASRVILEKIYEDDYSDIINANYIDCNDIKKAYIASEGPKNNFLNDFWRMIWQENVRNIVMIGNISDGTQEPIVQYWPETNSVKFLDITVRMINKTLFANYVDRVLLVTQAGKERKINHLQYISWPNQGFPSSAQFLISFVQQMGNMKMNGNFPILVHCGTGTIRTGTIILCDITLRMAKIEKKVNIFKTISKVKSSRPSLVGDYNQYKLVHLVVLESLGLNTGIICNGTIKAKVPEIILNDIDEQMKFIEETQLYDTIINSNYNTMSLGTYSLINKVYVGRHHEENRFIVGQQPKRDKSSDFWKMVTENHCSVIVCLNKIDKPSDKFWPDHGEVLKPTKDVLIKHETNEKLETHQIIHLFVYCSTINYELDVVLYNNWMPNQIIPSNALKFVTFIEKAELFFEKSKITIITCFDGTTACGLFLSLVFVIQKINLEHVCDICQAVRHARHHQKKFVREKEQFIFLYKAALEYVKNCESYANFTE